MSLEIEVNGIPYTRAKSIEVGRYIKSVSGSFALGTSAAEQIQVPVKVGDAVKILADGTPVLTGYAEELSVANRPDSHDVFITGRDNTADFIDSTVKGSKEFTTPISLESLTRQVLDGLGLTNVFVGNAAGGLKNFTESDSISAEIGQTAYDFIELQCRRQQVLLGGDGRGNILLQRAGSQKSGINLVRKQGDNTTNILESALNKNNTQRFNSYLIQSQQNPSFLDFSPKEIVSQSGQSATDSEIRTTRFLEIDSEEDMDSETSINRADFEANIRRANSFQYIAVVQGHSFNGKTFKVNETIQVSDDFCDINATLLIDGLTFKYDLQSGSTTEISMTYKDAYTLQAVLDQADAAREDTGGAFSFL